MTLDIARLTRLSKRIVSDPRWQRYYLQRYVRRPAVRNLVSRAVARFKPRIVSRGSGVEHQSRLDDLRNNGIVLLPTFAPLEHVDELRSHLGTVNCFDPDRPDAKGAPWPAVATPGCVHAYYKVEDLLKAPHVLAFANDAELLRLVSGVFGCRPTVCEINCWWLHHSFDREMAKVKHDFFVMHNNKEYHRDIDDWSMLRFFLYLTDVDHGGGPHSYIPGSHKLHLGQRRARRFATNDDPLLQTKWDVVGPAGTALLMDPYGLHRATVPTTTDRLVLSITYSLGTTNVFAPRRPLLQRPQGIRTYENRLFLAD